MNEQFDELAKGMVRSVTRRGALTRFSLGLAGIALATLGLPNQAHADRGGKRCNCSATLFGCDPLDYACQAYCLKHCHVKGGPRLIIGFTAAGKRLVDISAMHVMLKHTV